MAKDGGAGGAASTRPSSTVAVSNCDWLSGEQYRRVYVRREGSYPCRTDGLSGAGLQPASKGSTEVLGVIRVQSKNFQVSAPSKRRI